MTCIIRGMKAIIEIDMDNAAFDKPNAHFQLAKVLSKMAHTVEIQIIEEIGHMCTEADDNGNYVGRLEIVEGNEVITQGDKKLKEMTR